MFMSMVIFFNLIENFPIIFINSGIMLKEFTLPFYQMITNRKAPSEEDRIQLSLISFEDAIVWYVKVFNPGYVAVKIFTWILGWNPLDMIIENKDDEEHFYARPVVKPITDNVIDPFEK